MLVDTSGVLAALFPDQDDHQQCGLVLSSVAEPPLLSPFVLGELDYMIGRRSTDAALEFLDEVANGAYTLVGFTAHQVGRARAIATRYRDLEIGLSDASIIVLAQDRGITELLTLDHRHFRVLAKETPLRLLPADSG